MFRFHASAVLLVLVSLHTRVQAESWQAGAASANITPEKSMWMAGYGGRNKPSEGKLTDLWAKALVLQDPDGNRALMITLDLVGIGRQLSQSVCDQLRRDHGFERHQIAICTSHTHTGPVVGDNLASLHYRLLDAHQQQLVDEYAELLHKQIAAVVAQAVKKVAPASLTWGSGTAEFAVNRRNNRAADVPRLRAEGKLQGPFDHDVPVLAVRHDGKLSAVVFGYACHATVLSFYQWSGDYPGFAQIELEAKHPGCVALFFAGCGADQNPLPRRTVELAKDYGRQLAESVDRVLSGEMIAIDGPLTAKYREIDLPLAALPSREQIETDAQSTNKYHRARAKMLLEQLDADGELRQTYPYPIGTWRLGKDVQFVSLGGEVVVDFALRLKSELSGTKTWVAGYANDVMAYIPSRRVLREGGYEGGGAMVYYGLPTVWAPEVEERIVSGVHEQLPAE